MPRPPRSFEPNAYYHVFARGSNRQALTIDDADRHLFLACLDRALTRYRLSCIAYCLMPNHYHVVMRVPDDRISGALKLLNGTYSLRFNRRYGRDAHLFKNRFKAVLVATESQLQWACAYTAANPVRARLCAKPEEWPWSSYRASIGVVSTPRMLDRADLLSLYAGSAGTPCDAYRRLVATCAELKRARVAA
jgi:REP element-mobilizing transposase RayT